MSHTTQPVEANAINGLSKEQWEKLVRMLGEIPEETRLNGKTCRDDLIVDSGAFHHMKFFILYTHSPPMFGWSTKWKVSDG